MDKKDERQLERVYHSLRTLFVQNQDLKLGHVLALLAVAVKEGQSVVEIQNRIGMTQSTASRYLLELSEWGNKDTKGVRQKGMNVVESREDFSDRSVRRQYLTRKGVETITTILEKLRKPEE